MAFNNDNYMLMVLARSQRGAPGARALLLQNLNIYTYIYLRIYTTQLNQFVSPPPPQKILATREW